MSGRCPSELNERPAASLSGEDVAVGGVAIVTLPIYMTFLLSRFGGQVSAITTKKGRFLLVSRPSVSP